MKFLESFSSSVFPKLSLAFKIWLAGKILKLPNPDTCILGCKWARYEVALIGTTLKRRECSMGLQSNQI